MKNQSPSNTPDLFSGLDRKKLKDAFYDALSTLTKDQKKAVELIEGPVMVLAGPGTGKTQVLAARYGYILDQTDTSINQILCLTYSDAGVQAMRERLFSFIGPAAHEAHIFTYHAFCNKVLQENPEYFFDFKKFKLASDLQRFELIEQILLELPDDHVLKRVIGDRHFDIRRLSNQYQNIKKEERDIPKLIQEIRDYIDKMHTEGKYLYQRHNPLTNSKKGDLKKDYYLDKAKFERAIDALQTFYAYQDKMQANQWIDFQDMLIRVKEAFGEHPELLARYQENYQYILVDEFQDTNAIQNNILLKLCEYWENPNLFVVGDDDQAIYRFQGADEQNLINIITRYPSIDIICITENFRSTQALLDSANHVIEKLEHGRVQNQQLSIPPHILAKISKKLVASTTSALNIPPLLQPYQNAQQETLAIFDFCKGHQNLGLNLSELAIICRHNRTMQDLLYLLELEGIPVNLRLGKNILEEPFIQHFLILLRYLDAEYHMYQSGEPYLIQLMYLPYWGLSPNDVAKIAFLERRTRDNKNLAEKILDPASWPEATFEDRSILTQFIQDTQTWIKALPPVQTLPTICEDILRSSGMLQWALQSNDRTWHLRSINTFFQVIKNEIVENPGLTLEKFLGRVTKMENFDLKFPIETGYSSEQGVNLLTAHSAKGREYEKVWIMYAIAADWEGFNITGDQPYKLPDHVSQIEQTRANKPHDERRLFYVAMTRARRELIVSWPLADNENNAQRPSTFVTELRDFLQVDPRPTEVPDTLLKEKMLLIQNKKLTPPALINHQLIDKFLQTFVMSSTELNLYLDCPRKFYFEEILKVPRAINAHLGLGISVHEALHEYFYQALKNETFDEEYLVDFFVSSMKRNEWYFTQEEYEGLIRKFSHQLPLFLKQHHTLWKNVTDYKLEYYLDRINFEGIPINGKLDQVLKYGDRSIIVDFKSGRGDSTGSIKKTRTSKKGSQGGDYWRQGAFYKFLLDHDTKNRWDAYQANILFLQPNKLEPEKFECKPYEYSPEDLTLVASQIKETYTKITDHQFDIGCEDSGCDWCNYIKNHELINSRNNFSETQD
ncbi:MAG: ATP-dependent helicase [Saprospiraceae bacterium]|nr:ATP-dependent helicase [Saprospiraceae bacterium]